MGLQAGHFIQGERTGCQRNGLLQQRHGRPSVGIQIHLAVLGILGDDDIRLDLANDANQLHLACAVEVHFAGHKVAEIDLLHAQNLGRLGDILLGLLTGQHDGGKGLAAIFDVQCQRTAALYHFHAVYSQQQHSNAHNSHIPSVFNIKDKTFRPSYSKTTVSSFTFLPNRRCGLRSAAVHPAAGTRSD